jgi:hypothetical protein
MQNLEESVKATFAAEENLIALLKKERLTS